MSNKKYVLGVDIGGSHIASAIVDVKARAIVLQTKAHRALDSQQKALKILNIWVACIKETLNNCNDFEIDGVGISMPGPTNYKDGISKMRGCNKYEQLYGLDIRNYLWKELKEWVNEPSKITFVNDANSFLLGEKWIANIEDENIAAITLGTGIGSGFSVNDKIVTTGENVPSNGEVYNVPFKTKTAEDWISTRWFLKTYKERFGTSAKNVKEIAEKARASEKARAIFEDFGENLGGFLAPVLKKFKTDTLIFGGNITKSYDLFKTAFENNFKEDLPKIHFAKETENSAILGAVKHFLKTKFPIQDFRVTQQYLMPIEYDKDTPKNSYNIYPSFEIEKGKIHLGFTSLAKELASYKSVCIDGYLGVDWKYFISNLTMELHNLGVNSIAYSSESALKSSKDIDEMIAPFLGGDDPVFGRLYDGNLLDFIEVSQFDAIKPDTDCLSILYGSGASLSSWNSKVIYVDVPKNEIQFRSRARRVCNIGAMEPLPPKKQYKRMFFVDWPVLNKHKQSILKKIDYIVDTQQLNEVSWCDSTTFMEGLAEISKNAFRVRPWFEPGVWGGDWIKRNIEGLNKDVVNYAWSFEFIVPENGIVFSKNGIRLEVSFDMLMYYDNQAVLGDATSVFGTDFPIRFDFLDTFKGDNLSLQCHPKPNFIKEHFSEKFTQDETYYMLDAKEDAEVYLGFHEDINKKQFHQALLKSEKEGTIMDVKKYVQVHPAKKHDLFLIPNGIIHCSGKNGMVLEISSTPYIYTFKLYDWMRKDLDGNSRPLNIARGMQNLNFECKGKKVKEDYISKQRVVDKGVDWSIVQLSTHPKHFYEVYRMEFTKTVRVKNNEQCHLLSLVEGQQINVITNNRTFVVNYAETFVIPAKTKTYQLVNLGEKMVKVIQSNVKPTHC